MPPYEVRPYDRQRAVDYAHKWAYFRNPDYYDFSDIGGDCTNFSSQCLHAGSGVMNYTKTMGWYYSSLHNRAPAWTGVHFLYNFLTRNTGVGPFATEVGIELVEPGDLVQLAIYQEEFHHCPFIVDVQGEPSLESVYIAAHTFDCDNRPLHSYDFRAIRYLHIEGVRHGGHPRK